MSCNIPCHDQTGPLTVLSLLFHDTENTILSGSLELTRANTAAQQHHGQRPEKEVQGSPGSPPSLCLLRSPLMADNGETSTSMIILNYTY